MSSSAADKVVDAAAQLFAERGYQATTTRQLAERAGVNEVSVFRGFGNKQGVLAAVVQRVVAEQPGRASSALAELPLAEAVSELARREVTNGLRDGGLMTRLAFEARTLAEFKDALAEAKSAPRTTVIVVHTDNSLKVPGYESWWDVAVAEVSKLDDVQAARKDYEEQIKKERFYF